MSLNILSRLKPMGNKDDRFETWQNIEGHLPIDQYGGFREAV